MLRFSDFSHLPEVDGLIGEVLAERSGLILVAGPDARQNEPGEPALPQFLPSGRATIFRILVGELLDAHPGSRAVLIAEDKDVLHVARRFRQRMEFIQVKSPLTYDEAIRGHDGRQRHILVVDRIEPDNLGALLDAAAGGKLVVTQLDTIYYAQAVARYLIDLGATAAALDRLRWVIGIQRLPLLCARCKQAAEVSDHQLAQLSALAHRYPALTALHAPSDGGAYCAAGSCPHCRETGRQGDVAIFDFFRGGAPAADLWARPSALPMEAYVWMLAQRGQVALNDALNFAEDQLHRTFSLLMQSERRATQSSLALERKSVELDSANRLLNQRTRELVALEGIGQALITWNDLSELGTRVIRTALELSRADRGALYYVRSADWAQILASQGWTAAENGLGLARGTVFDGLSDRELINFTGLPPGISAPADSPPLRAGLAVPLVAHGIPAGLMVIQSTRKARFAQGEVALLETLAGYAAVAMQRAGLVEQLRSKIEALEAAQEDLAQKERLERELELARQLQLSMLPRTFPDISGLAFAAGYAPARHVGGDFYDVIRLDDDRVGLVIADVSDKGMPAALYMALTRSLILAAARQFASPAEVLGNVNELLLEVGQQDMFVTVFYGVLNPHTRQLIYARGGHDRPMLMRDGNIEPLGGRGMALGLFADDLFNVSEETVALRPGDRLVLFTDGLIDVVNEHGEMLESDRLRAIAQVHSDKSPAMFCRALFDDLAAFQGQAPQFDDMALVVAALG